MDPTLVTTSKFLSLVLRHKPSVIGIELDDGGWVEITTLLAAAHAAGKTLNEDLLLRVVHDNDKQRFAVSEDGLLIRANQGHSIDIDLGLEAVEPPSYLFHGTVERFIASIAQQGLIPGSRQHVHLSANRKTAELVGRRRGQPVILVVDAFQMYAEGHKFFCSRNGVWLVDSVPPEHIQFSSSSPKH